MQPSHTRAEAINAVQPSLTTVFQKGSFDAYFADVDGQPTWVVEDNGLNDVMSVGPPGHATTIVFHHYVVFVADSSLSVGAGFSCP